MNRNNASSPRTEIGIKTKTSSSVSHSYERQDRLVAATDVLGKKWHLVILDLLQTSGPLGFCDLESAIDGISAKVLSDSLCALESKGLVDRTVLSERPVRVEYSLTIDGHRFQPIIATIRNDFDGLDWIDAERPVSSDRCD
ncbi:winged helix-turn-helix transcriptional regulator [Natronorubrum thiooxidans]|uniref:Transcriptional regulator, HxlR family n=1 Tax=Natronorubrum thiooxidans TaxID=308853 RepID=A0A1N7GMB4_9EURY|nr:transcriptional regulator, HxlR family [Natronorubrum thiooxidans]